MTSPRCHAAEVQNTTAGYSIADWIEARRPVPRLWIRSAEVRGEGGGGGVGNVVRRMGTQQQQFYSRGSKTTTASFHL